jgi:ATP adenylyltransferase
MNACQGALCNENKGARDDTDFRTVRAEINKRHEGCIFCNLTPARVIAQNELAVAIRDGFPVTPLRTLVISRRHAASFFDLFESERSAIDLLLDELRAGIQQVDKMVTGFNLGFNCGEVAGQTVMHCHAHLIPRRAGDIENPRGGVRGVIPGKASY